MNYHHVLYYLYLVQRFSLYRHQDHHAHEMDDYPVALMDLLLWIVLLPAYALSLLFPRHPTILGMPAPLEFLVDFSWPPRP